MTRNTVAQRVVALMEDITAAGPELAEYDGLRVFDHPQRAIWQLTGQSHLVTPVTLDLWPALTCNARCPLCQYRVSGARDDVDKTNNLEIMSPQLAGEIFAGAFKFGVRSVILTGGGEPTLNPDLASIARAARVNGLRWGLNTNAFEINEQLVMALLAEAPAYIKISIDAGGPDTHSAIYNVPKEHYQTVLNNTIMAVRASARLGLKKFGLSFTLAAKTSDSELDRIRDVIDYILRETNGALSFVVFRARLLHYRGNKPVAPQPAADRFPILANAIEERVIGPLRDHWGSSPKFDLKKGLFALAARPQLPGDCLSNSWMTTITHEGEGYATGELAGAKHSGQCWGRIAAANDFEKFWKSETRISLHRKIENGEIPLPIVHRTSPVDEFLRRIATEIDHPLTDAEACSIIESTRNANSYRSSNSDFV